MRDFSGVLSPNAPWAAGAAKNLTLLQDMSRLAAQRDQDLCYWSMQTLPAPVPQLNFSRFDAETVMNHYGEMATSRLQAQITPEGPLQFVGCAFGHFLRSKMCEMGLNTSFSCNPALKEQEVP